MTQGDLCAQRVFCDLVLVLVTSPAVYLFSDFPPDFLDAIN